MIKTGISSVVIGLIFAYCERYLFRGVIIADSAEVIIAYTIAIIGLGILSVNFILAGIIILWRS
jgi:hypothetical protein